MHAQRHDLRHFGYQLARAVHAALLVKQTEQGNGQHGAIIVQLRGAHFDRAAVWAEGGDAHGAGQIGVVRGSPSVPRQTLLLCPVPNRGQDHGFGEPVRVLRADAVAAAAALQLMPGVGQVCRREPAPWRPFKWERLCAGHQKPFVHELLDGLEGVEVWSVVQRVACVGFGVDPEPRVPV